jgi:hypothetical protein
MVLRETGVLHQRVFDSPRPPLGGDCGRSALFTGLKPDVEDGVGRVGVLDQPSSAGLLLQHLRTGSNSGVPEVAALGEQLEWCPAVADPGDWNPEPV